MMSNSYTHTLFIYVALPCEAKHIVEYFKLKKQFTVQPFAVYLNKDICLTVTGLGKSAMAAAVGYTQALFCAVNPAVLVNFGVAGHQYFNLGDLFLMTKITDFESGRHYYPSSIYSLPCATAGIQTVSTPVLEYDSVALCDMEASAFYESAIRFVSSEFIFCLKVVSDNQYSIIDNVQSKQVIEWVAQHTEIFVVLSNFAIRQAELKKVGPNFVSMTQLLEKYHFTVNESNQLKAFIEKWDVLTDQKLLFIDDMTPANSKQILRWMELKVRAIDFYL